MSDGFVSETPDISRAIGSDPAIVYDRRMRTSDRLTASHGLYGSNLIFMMSSQILVESGQVAEQSP